MRVLREMHSLYFILCVKKRTTRWYRQYGCLCDNIIQLCLWSRSYLQSNPYNSNSGNRQGMDNVLDSRFRQILFLRRYGHLYNQS